MLVEGVRGKGVRIAEGRSRKAKKGEKLGGSKRIEKKERRRQNC